jgi:hypothetical protein
LSVTIVDDSYRKGPSSSKGGPGAAANKGTNGLTGRRCPIECSGPEVDKAKHAIHRFHIEGCGYLMCYAPCSPDDGDTYPNGLIVLGPSAFKSDSWLGSNLGHEIEVHWDRQMQILGAWTSCV